MAQMHCRVFTLGLVLGYVAVSVENITEPTMVPRIFEYSILPNRSSYWNTLKVFLR